MLKTVSSVANALGALNYKGTWNATTNTPALASGVGIQGDYYVVGVAGTTNIDGITNWGVGDWATFNGSVWQRVEGGADGNFDNLSVLGTSTLTGNVQVVTGDITVSAGDLVIGTSGNGIDFSATADPGGMTSELLDDYEEGTFTPTWTTDGTDFGSVTYDFAIGSYVKVGDLVTIGITIRTDAITVGSASGNLRIGGLPYVVGANGSSWAARAGLTTGFASGTHETLIPVSGASILTVADTANAQQGFATAGIGANDNFMAFQLSYRV